MVPSQAPRILRRWIILFKNQELVDLDRLAWAVELKASEFARLDWREDDAGPSLNSLVGMDHRCTLERDWSKRCLIRTSLLRVGKVRARPAFTSILMLCWVWWNMLYCFRQSCHRIRGTWSRLYMFCFKLKWSRGNLFSKNSLKKPIL
jgi:hypothetical protein